MNQREILLKRVQICDFVLNDTALFLDTHPTDPMALGYYKKYLTIREKASKEFVEKYGPLVRSDYAGGPRWDWVDEPWPWQNKKEA